MSANEHAITPEVGKRYITRGGWITAKVEINPDSEMSKHYPLKAGDIIFTVDGRFFKKRVTHQFDMISEYVEPTQPDTFRRDLEAAIYVKALFDSPNIRPKLTARFAIDAADALIEAMEAAK